MNRLAPKWTATLPEAAFLEPIVDGGRVVFRCRTTLVALHLDSGAEATRWPVDPNPRLGDVFAAGAGVFVIDRAPELRSSELVGVTLDRGVIWERRTDSQVTSAWAVSGDVLYAVGQRGKETILHRFHLPTGEPLGDVPLPQPVSYLVPWGERLLCARLRGSPGLYATGTDGTDATTLVEEKVRQIHSANDRLLIVRRGADGHHLDLRGRDLATRWTVPAPGEAAALGEDELLCVASNGDGAVPAMRAADDGSLRWTGAALEKMPTRCYFANQLVGFRTTLGLTLLHRGNGSLAGTLEAGSTLTAIPGGALAVQVEEVHCYAAA